MKVEVTVKLDVAYRVDDKTGDHISWCPALGIYSQGETEKEADEAIKSAMLNYLRICFQRKILDSILVRHGFSPVASGPGAGDGADHEENCEMISIRELASQKGYHQMRTIDVPLHLVQQPAAA